MISIGPVSSAGAASTYFAKENYYTAAQGLSQSEWFGKGAVRLGVLDPDRTDPANTQESPHDTAKKNDESTKTDPKKTDTKNIAQLNSDKTDPAKEQTAQHDFSNTPDKGQGERPLKTNNVNDKDFKAILQGKVSATERTGRMGKDGEWQHNPGKDMVFSPSKSVSIMHLVGGDARLGHAWKECVKETLTYAEKQLASVQDNPKKGPHTIYKTGNMTAALFTHDTSRNQDPLLHIHAVIANMTFDDRSGKFRALYQRPLYQNRYVLSKMTDALMAEKVKSLGYQIEKTGKHGSFEITAVPKDVIKMFSSRRNEIEQHLDQKDSSWNERQNATYTTRKGKTECSRDELTAQWKDKGEAKGFKASDHVPAADKAKSAEPYSPTQLALAVRDTIADKTYTQTTVTHADLITGILNHPRMSGNLTNVSNAINNRIKKGILIPHDKIQNGQQVYTTNAQIKAEKDIIATISETKGQSALLDKTRGKLIGRLNTPYRAGDGREYTLNKAQVEAAYHLLTSKDKYIGIQGLAGVGKTTALGIAVDTYKEAMNRTGNTKTNIIGLGPTKTSASELADKIGGKDMTVQMYIRKNAAILNGIKPTKAALKQYKGAVILHDESSLLSYAMTRDFMKINKALNVEKVVLIGDQKQHESIQAGPAFKLMQQSGMKTKKIDIIIRQKNETLLTVAKQVSSGQFKEAFTTLDKADRLHEGPYYLERAADQYLQHIHKGENVVAITPDNISRQNLNDAIRREMQRNGTLSNRQIEYSALVPTHTNPSQATYSQNYQKGEKLMFVQDIYNRSISKGDVWNIEKTDHNTNTLHLSLHGKKEIWKLQRLKQLPFQHMRDEKLSLAPRDQIKFKSDSPQHGIARDGKAVISHITDSHLTFRMSNGESLLLARLDPVARMIDHSYTITTHVSQGITKDHVVGVLRPDTNATNQPAVDVMFTRGVHGLNVYTPDAAKTLDKVISNEGSDKIASEITPDDHQNTLDNLRQNTAKLQTDRDLARPEPVRVDHGR